jgi:dTDP-4-amino-4,6-dideoxygalactose transaminase
MKTMDHAAYIKKTKRMSQAELLFVIKDASEALEAQPYGQNAGYYADEINYCSMELHKRKETV